MGVVKDLSFVMYVLPANIFPNDERTIGVLAGFSLGGHAAWLGLRHGTHTPPSPANLPPSEPSFNLSRSLAL